MNLKNSINLIQWYYHFLYMWQYLDQHIKKTNLSKDIQKTTVQTGDDTTFWFNTKTLESLFASAHKHPDKDNIFGYMVELNAIRWIIFTMRELIENSPVFKRFLQEKISNQYLPFEQVIRLTRNVFAHSYDPKLTIIKENFIHQKVYRSSKWITKMHFLFTYSEYWEERKGDKDYGLDISINFEKLKAGTPLYTAFPRHQLYLFCELCYNLTKVFNAINSKSKTKKRIKIKPQTTVKPKNKTENQAPKQRQPAKQTPTQKDKKNSNKPTQKKAQKNKQKPQTQKNQSDKRTKKPATTKQNTQQPPKKKKQQNKPTNKI